MQRRPAIPVIHCKLEENALTVPRSRRMRFVPNNNLGTDDIAAAMCEIAPILTPHVVKTAISAYNQTIQRNMIKGNHLPIISSNAA